MGELDLSPQEEELEALRSIYDVCTPNLHLARADSARLTGKTFHRKRQHGTSKEKTGGGPSV